jgi:hypothetical protein
MRNVLVVFSLLFITCAARADITVDLGATYSGDVLNTTTDSNNTQYFYNVGGLFNLDKGRRWNLGWMVLGISQSVTNAGTSTTYSSFDMGPALRWQIDKSGIFSVTAAYGYITKGSYNSGSTSETWSGTSYFGQFAVQAPIGDAKYFIGLSLNYYAASYSQKVVNSVESSNSAQKSWIFPMISFTWRP